MSQAAILEVLSEVHRKHLDPSSPAPLRMMAAKGLAPLPPREQVMVLVGLAGDADSALSTAAKASFAKLPDKLLVGAVDGGLPPSVLADVAVLAAGRDVVEERIVLHRETPDDVIASVAGIVSEAVAEIISNNQERCMRSEAIVRALRENPKLLRSSLDRLFDFLVRAGVIYDMPESADAMARLTPADMDEALAKIELPPDVHALLTESPDAEARADEAAAALDAHAPDAKEEAEKRMPMLKLISTLRAAQKVALAIKGNKEARAILVRDSNRMVASAAIRNPRITEQEVVTAAKSRSVSDDVIRIIAGSKELSRTYGVKVALVNNPKTPLATAMRMLTLLRDTDVRSLAKSKNVSQAITNQAKRLLATKA